MTLFLLSNNSFSIFLLIFNWLYWLYIGYITLVDIENKQNDSTQPGFKPVSSVNAQPLYKQVQAAIREAISAHTLKPDDALPPERELSAQFDVSRITIRKAIAGLVNEGVLDTHHGSGTFVRSKVDKLSLIHISEPTRQLTQSRLPSCA